MTSVQRRRTSHTNSRYFAATSPNSSSSAAEALRDRDGLLALRAVFDSGFTPTTTGLTDLREGLSLTAMMREPA